MPWGCITKSGGKEAWDGVRKANCARRKVQGVARKARKAGYGSREAIKGKENEQGRIRRPWMLDLEA